MATVHDRAAGVDASVIPNRWDAALAARFTPEQLLLYRSNLLGRTSGSRTLAAAIPRRSSSLLIR